MIVRWLGHSCFLITAGDGTRILTDPFNEKVGYPLPRVEADVVTVSHEHGDHNNTAAVLGDFQVIRTPGLHVVRGVTIQGTAAYHDSSFGSARGKNTLFKITADGISVLHCGDLGHVLDEPTAGEVGHVDVLLVPVGGHYTIDSQEAAQVVGQLKPTITIPMHYRTPVVEIPITTVDPFIQAVGGRQLGAAQLEITPETLADLAGVVILDL